jgi:23S rRNA pseudouridine1911/1915/1917 synthase
MTPLLLDWLVRKYPLAKRQNLRRMVQQGRVTINATPARNVKHPVTDKDQVVVSDRIEKPQASIAPLRIIHEDADILVVHKPPGLLTSTVPREHRPTAVAIIRKYLADREPAARVGVIHRLDRDASGLLVFSKNNPAYESLKRQFFEHSVERLYTAVVHGSPKEKSGRIESFLVELPDGSVRVTGNRDKGQLSITEYTVLAEAGSLSLLRVKLHTGRKHQIRVHLAELGTPVVGDQVYSPPKQAKLSPRLLLAATTLGLSHPRTGEPLVFQMRPPPEILRAFPDWKLQ